MKKIYARKCRVEVILDKIGKNFINENHTQKMSKAPLPIYIGLFYKNDLVGVALFTNPKTKRKKEEYSRELLRLCFKKGLKIQGGASKMIKFYIKNYNPNDFFTYQDTTGENSKVYENAGMRLVKDGKKTKKQYLVAPNKNILTASRKECLSMAYAVKYGPDRILGTKIGEMYHKDTNKRKSNREIFLEDLGWHIEETSGDSIYEWFNENITFYVYKITSTVDQNYYIGRRKINKNNATIEDCKNDNYMGSGGVKFQNWINKVGKENLKKEILHILKTKKDAVIVEEKELGELYRTDPNCKNSHRGGTGNNANSWNDIITIKVCNIHGETKFIGNHCYSCKNEKLVNFQTCKVHGLVKHIGDSCVKCSANKSASIRECSIHGETKFIGSICRKCSMKKQWTIQECSIHGKTKFQGKKCKKCSVNKNIKVKKCSIHGETKFYNSFCYKCHIDPKISIQECEIHGETKHKKDKCCKCSIHKKDTVGFCSIHGETKFQYSKCLLCIKEKRDSLKECTIHGMTQHRGESCYTCTIEKANLIKTCTIHGETKHRGNKCCKCSSEKAAHKRFHVNLNKHVKNCRFCK